ncbi:hypothetical protein [Plantibacter sp. YIM 135249]|uniref:hypothetical protein n=1 Tax=Plantibacter sp. YIM 135249 TaxID=3423918 RepID=UPI003D345562
MKRTLSAAALCVLAVLAVPTAANAAEGYGPGSCNSITPTSVAQGTAVSYSCDDFWQPGQDVAITISGDAANALTVGTSTKSITVKADAAGSIALDITTGKSSLGTYTLTAKQGAITDSSDFTVVEAGAAAAAATSDSGPATADSGSPLADTGFQGTVLPWIAGGLLAAGLAALAVVLVRRRKEA